MNIETILNHYAVCALWSSTGDDDRPLDDNYGVDDIALEAMANMRADVVGFCEAQAVDLAASGLSDKQIGHDFWLTRNSHGAGFWDRGIGEVGKRLTDACKTYGSQDMYVGDDGKIYVQ